MREHGSAIGREVGKVDTDSNGLARYSLKIQVPRGVHFDNAPELSLEYCQGTPNGSLGVGWALGGVSAIRRAPANTTSDAFNQPPDDYDRSQPKLTLDGAELLKISGVYGEQGAQYTTETGSTVRIVEHFESGFVIKEPTRKRAEYGTTGDSRVVISGTETVREWRLKRLLDYHGNAITYDYATSPRANVDGFAVDENTCYLSSIRYGATDKTSLEGGRIVKLEYKARPDPVSQAVLGEKCTWASLLSTISIGVVRREGTSFHQFYGIEYSRSPSTGDTYLASVTESYMDGSDKVELLPSVFGYTSPEVSRQQLFQTVEPQSVTLKSSSNNQALFTMNVSGKCLADIVVVRYEPISKKWSLKTYLASRGADGKLSWKPSTGPGAEAQLPLIDASKGFPSILSPDMNNDGRADFIVPYADNNRNLRFSISQCLGTGYQDARTKATEFNWVDGSKFMAIDLSGRGTIDIVQIFTDKKKLAFRNFPAITQNKRTEIGDATTTSTSYENVGTLDWFPLNHAATGAKSLVRIWSEDVGKGRIQLKATTFALSKAGDSSSGFREYKSSLLGPPTHVSKAKYTVLPCDINADGTLDVVIAVAEFDDGQWTLTFDVYLGDGYGTFSKHDTIKQKVKAPSPLDKADNGAFHTSNINGSNYPSLAYVYQEKVSKTYTCLAVDGRSDGLVGDATVYPIVKGLSTSAMNVLATDINGNGMGDWLFYSLSNDLPQLVPVYNRAQVTDFLAWAQDPMGLRTNLTYGCLSDPAVYTSGINWSDYENDSKDSYPVIAAPGYVVTELYHHNDTLVNSLAYELRLKKTYAKARINFLGRGWQGFEEIHTLNSSDGILTTEKYLQVWPLSGLKTQVDTKSGEGVVVKSSKVAYEPKYRTLGPWKVYRADKTLEQTDMIENGSAVTSNITRYEYDTDGNIITNGTAAYQLGQIIVQSWKRCTYESIDGVTGVLVSEKITSKEDNINPSIFEPGDIKLTTYENEPNCAVLKSISEWSSDVNDFFTTRYKFNSYGKEISRVTDAGFNTTTTYDDIFHTFPIKVEKSGPGFSSTELTAFDERSGLESARLGANGLLTCYSLDALGRVHETRARALQDGQSTILASEFLAQKPFVADESLVSLLSEAHLDPQRKVAFERKVAGAGTTMSVKIITYAHEGSSGQHEATEYLDCLKRVRKRSFRNADEENKTWVACEYDSSGRMLFESFPTNLALSHALEWVPDRSLGTQTEVDILGRITKTSRPAHGNQSHFIVSDMRLLDGGTRVQERTVALKDLAASIQSGTELSRLERRYVEIGNESYIVENVDENGLRSSFVYDALGRLVKSTDAAGNVETRCYNSRAGIVSIDNGYQNTTGNPGSVAVLSKYNNAGHLVTRSNAANETITFDRDAKGRVLKTVGQDGREIQYAYDSGGFENIASITIIAAGSSTEKFESRFEFKYDHRGRTKQQKVTLSDGTSFETSTSYDWQDREVERILPNGTVRTVTYRGSDVVTDSLSGGSQGAWSVKAQTLKYHPCGRPELLTVEGDGIGETFTHNWEYDVQGFPMKHTLATNNGLAVHEDYTYNDLDQLAQKTDGMTGSTTSYSYNGKRLASSHKDAATDQYIYDLAGNLTNKSGTSIKYSPKSIEGTRGGAPEFQVTYDECGRTIKRQTARGLLNFSYDSFGSLQNLAYSGGDSTIQLFNDFDGEMFARKSSNGTMEVFVDGELSICTKPDGSRRTVQQLVSGNGPGSDIVLATVSTDLSVDTAEVSGSGGRSVEICFTDTKSNVTHVFKGSDSSLSEKRGYDDFGSLSPTQSDVLDAKDTFATYEGRYLDQDTGLINFGGRWYDPLIGRFTTPDDILDIGSLVRTDGLNRYAFENNDPINNSDPTGHWSWNAVLGVVAGAALVVGAIALTVATGGAAAPLLAAGVGALASGGIAGIAYSVAHRDEENAGKFWGGFGMTVGINAAIGAATGALGVIAGPAKAASAIARIGGRAAVGAVLGGTSSVLSTAGQRGVENIFYGKHHDLFEGAATNFMTGAAAGAFFSAIGSGGKPKQSNAGPVASKTTQPFKLSAKDFSQITAPKPSNPWLTADFGGAIRKLAVKTTIKQGGKVGYAVTEELGINDMAKSGLRSLSLFSNANI